MEAIIKIIKIRKSGAWRMKAYYLSVEGRDEAGGVIVFAENYKQAIGN